MSENRWDSSTGIFSLLLSTLSVWGGQRSDTGQPPQDSIDGKIRGGNRSCLTQILTCCHPELPFPSNTQLIKQIIIKNTKYGKKHAYSWQFRQPSRRELRTAMMIPVIYEQLKRKKLKIHKGEEVKGPMFYELKQDRNKKLSYYSSKIILSFYYEDFQREIRENHIIHIHLPIT